MTKKSLEELKQDVANAEAAVSKTKEALDTAAAGAQKKEAGKVFGEAKKSQTVAKKALAIFEASEEKTSNEKEAQDVGDNFEVTSKAPRRRAGIRFGPTSITITRSDFDDAQWLALKNDTMLKFKPAQ